MTRGSSPAHARRTRRPIEASAGTGKTYSLLSLVLRFVADGVSIERVLMVTFTRAATAELRGKSRQRLGDALAEFRARQTADDDLLAELAASHGESRLTACFSQAYAQLDLAEAHTIHGFCQRVIGKHCLLLRAAFRD